MMTEAPDPIVVANHTGRIEIARTLPHLSESELSSRIPQAVLDETLYDWVAVERIFVPAYGRPYSQNKVNDLLRAWDWYAVGTLLVSFRHLDNTFALIDGQHRLFAARLQGWEAMPCRIFIDLSYEREAELYNLYATVHRQSALDRFRARIEAKDPETVAIRRVLLDLGMDVAIRGTGPNKVASVQAIEYVVKHYGLDHFRVIAGVLYDAWNNSARAWVGDAIVGMSSFIARYEALMHRERLITQLRTTSPDRMLIDTNTSKLTHGKSYSKQAFGIEIWKLYNQGARGAQKLPAWEEVHYSDKGYLAQMEGQRRAMRERHKDWAEAITHYLQHHREGTLVEIAGGTRIVATTVNTVLKEMIEDGVASRRAVRATTNSLVYVYKLERAPDA